MDIFLPGNIKFLRNQKGLTQVGMSKVIAIKKNTINHYEKGRSRPNLDTLILLSNFFGCSLDDLVLVDLPSRGVTGKTVAASPALTEKNVVVPLIESKPAAISFPDYFFSPGSLAALQVRGAAMAPTIKPGDYVIGRPIEPPAVRNGEVYLVSYPPDIGAGFVVRRCYYYHGDHTLVLTADNTDQPDETIPVTPDLQLYHVEACLTTQLPKAGGYGE